MKLKQAGINISIMSESKSFPWQSNYKHDYLMDDYHLRVYQRIAPYTATASTTGVKMDISDGD